MEAQGPTTTPGLLLFPRAVGDLGSSASLDKSLKTSEAEEEKSPRLSSSSVIDREEVGRGEVEEMEEEREAGKEG
uniref:Uncharacterized protein n=1 Tax=Chromera velia CCMP2878 TaxID=1169474 RepID=A0A0G4F1H1_9ALVE|eukprot:Cvel_2612.t1-p1 / transcript=Cvel_2612.t1 / gene=Cvel_2612 / organism=Chromera_velia_CCMP2878 / gene_product=hypothetical protein / transcript_product=hypothetical protein / location=Cvel_scaffold103:90895-92026(+) / protein_length=74 / sequence_SO=supercontig / SO=protein_coding / is_pseudo=false